MPLPAYRDRTFCYSDCKRSDCPRFLTEHAVKEARQRTLAIAKADLSTTCSGYVAGRNFSWEDVP